MDSFRSSAPIRPNQMKHTFRTSTSWWTRQRSWECSSECCPPGGVTGPQANRYSIQALRDSTDSFWEDGTKLKLSFGFWVVTAPFKLRKNARLSTHWLKV